MHKQSDTKAGISESFILQLLETSETVFGPESPQTGLLLLNLAEYLEQTGKAEEAEAVSQRYRSILCSLANQMGIKE